MAWEPEIPRWTSRACGAREVQLLSKTGLIPLVWLFGENGSSRPGFECWSWLDHAWFQFSSSVTGAAIGGFTLEIDKGQTKHRDHARHASVLSACGPTRKGSSSWERELFEKRQDLFLSEKRKRLTLFFSFLPRKDPLLPAFLFYLISFLRSKVTYTGSIL